MKGDILHGRAARETGLAARDGDPHVGQAGQIQHAEPSAGQEAKHRFEPLDDLVTVLDQQAVGRRIADSPLQRIHSDDCIPWVPQTRRQHDEMPLTNRCFGDRWSPTVAS